MQISPQAINKQLELMCSMSNYANKKSGTVAQTQLESLPDITFQV